MLRDDVILQDDLSSARVPTEFVDERDATYGGPVDHHDAVDANVETDNADLGRHIRQANVQRLSFLPDVAGTYRDNITPANVRVHEWRVGMGGDGLLQTQPLGI